MTDYERGFRDGVEAAAKALEEHHHKWHASAVREATQTIRALASPSPEKAQEPTTTSDETINLLDKHADKAMEYLKMNRGTEDETDADTRTLIWNQMSALLSDLRRVPAPPQPAPLPSRKCMVCDGFGRVWFEGASRPCDACAPLPEEGTPISMGPGYKLWPNGAVTSAPLPEEGVCPRCKHPLAGHDFRPVGCRVEGCICTHGEGTDKFPEPNPIFGGRVMGEGVCQECRGSGKAGTNPWATCLRCGGSGIRK